MKEMVCCMQSDIPNKIEENNNITDKTDSLNESSDVTMDCEDGQIVAHKRGISYNINEAVKIIV